MTDRKCIACDPPPVGEDGAAFDRGLVLLTGIAMANEIEPEKLVTMICPEHALALIKIHLAVAAVFR